ncbi:MAG: carboxypeptidase regulatory-like domain-containing protein [Sedimentisphaerales bacterium]|nr:carboxypeptidase regulatory-like domain-containing protein [Sedimentisphaerales bacterium]
MNELFHTIIGLPIIISIILKITIVLSAGWIAHLFVVRYNPRWRIVIWRCVIIGIFLVPALVPVRYFKIKVASEPEIPVISDSYSVSQSLDIAESSDFIIPPVDLPIESAYVSNQVSNNNPDTTKKSFSLNKWICQNIWSIAISSWLFITILLFVRLLVGFIRIKNVSRLSVSAPEQLNQLLSKVAADLNCHRKVRLYLSEQLHTPFLAGFSKPVIILPKQMVSDKHIQEAPAILAHEITHLCSGDLFWMLAARVVGIILWFHPLIWKLRNVHDSACEEVCDAVAANYVGSAELYSSTLARAALNVRGIVSTVGAIPMARSSNVIARLRTLKRKVYSSPIAKRWVVLSVSAIMLVFTYLGGLKLVYAEQNQSDKAIAESNDNENKPAIVSSQNEFVYEGELTFNKKLPVDLSAGTLEYPDLIKIKSLSIEGRYGNAWEVFVDFGWLPVVDSTWRITTELLDRDGNVLRYSRDRQTTFTFKASDTNQETRQYVELSTDSMHFQGRRHATRFRIILEPMAIKTGQLTDKEKKKFKVAALSHENDKPIEDAAVIVRTTSGPSEVYKTNSQGQCEIEINSENLLSLNIRVQKHGFAPMYKSWSNSSSSTGRNSVIDLPDAHTFEMLPTIEIGGILQNNQGKAIGGAKLSYYIAIQQENGNISIERCSLTDSNGKWKIEGVPSGIDYVSIGFRHSDYKGDNYTERRIRGQKLADAKEFKLVEVLTEGIKFTGIILDEEGMPIPDATVLMHISSAPYYDITDSEGKFKLVTSGERNDYRDDVPRIIVEASGYAPDNKEVDIVQNPEPLEFILTRGRSVKCHIVDGKKNPVIGAWAAIMAILDCRDYDVWLSDTDNNGDFIIPNVADHDIKLTVGKSGFITIRNYIIGPEETEITVEMRSSLTIKGTVTDALTNQPIANFGISAVQSNINPSERPVMYTNGKYELSFDESSSQTWKLYVSAVGYDTLISEEFNIEEDSKEINFELIRSSDYDEKTAGQVLQGMTNSTTSTIIQTYSGVVKDENGQLVEDVVISTRPWLNEDVVTDEKGKFIFKTRQSSGSTKSSPSLEETTYILARHRERNLAAAIEIGEDTENMEITLSPGIIFSGKVTDVNGIGLSYADISFTFWISDGGYSSREPVEIDSEGNFEIKAVPVGFEYSVYASSDGYGEKYIKTHTSEAVQNQIKLEPLVLNIANLSISGIVVDQFDQPISNARIYAYGNGQPSMLETYTNIKGEFTLTNICEGEISIQVSKNDTESLRARTTANGGDKDIKIMVSSVNSEGRLVPRQSASLVNRSFPNFENIEIDYSLEQAEGKRILICFWDIEQRPSRNLVSELSQRSDELNEKNVVVLLVHSSEITVDEINKWLDEYNIPFVSGRVVRDFERTLFKWNVRAQPWLILTDENAKILSEGFNLDELSDRLDNKNLSGVEQTQKGEISDTIVLKLLDSEGMPVSGARVGTNVETRDNKVLNSNLSWSLRNHENSISDQWGEVKLSREKLFPESWSQDRKVGLYILHEERKIGAVCDIKSKDDERNVIELTLVPVCHVFGKLDSKRLNDVGRPLYWTNVYMYWNKDVYGVLSHMSEEQRFEFIVPPGKYELYAYGSGRQKDASQGITASTKNNIFSIEVKAGESELDLGTVDLEPEKISAMVGKRAPEIGPIKEWKNGSPVKLADLISKAVILYFDGDSPNTSRDFPRLVELYDQFHDKGLEIISLYNCESMEQLEKNWKEALERFGGESEVPFRIAIDGGESGFYEGTDKVRLGQTYNTYDITKIPTTILIDTKGNVVGNIGLSQAKEIISQMFDVSIEPEFAEWRKNFNKVYFLEDGKVLKRIAPPFIPERKEYYQAEESSQYSHINNPPDYFTFHWDGKLQKWGYGFVGLKWTLKNVLNVNIRLNKNKYEGPEDLLGIEVPGDWIVRKDATMEQKLKALEEIIANELGRKIRFEKRSIEREAIVATGSFKYTRLPIAQDDRWILMFSGDFVDEEGGGGGTSDTVHEFLEAIGDRVNVPVIDETESPHDVKIPYRHYHSAYLSRVEDPNEKSEKLVQLLDNITLQTNLHFVIETRPIEKWFVVESE